MNLTGTLVNSSSGILPQELTSINGEAKAKGKTVEEQLWMETFPGRQSGTDWTRAAALSLLGWTFLPPAS